MSTIEDELYLPNEQIIFDDKKSMERYKEIKSVESNLKKKIILPDIDRENGINDLIKLQIAYTIGMLEGLNIYYGQDSIDEIWLYEYEKEKLINGGVAIVRDKKVIDFKQVWQKTE